MTPNEMVNRAYAHLDQDRVRYPVAELVDSGLTPAQDLLSLFKGEMGIRHTFSVPLPKESAFIHLLNYDVNIVRVNRVIVGDQTGDRSLHPSGELSTTHPLQPTQLEALSGIRPAWYLDLGMPRKYYLHGRSLMGVWPRPLSAATLTIEALCVPTPINGQALGPPYRSELSAGEHELVCELAQTFMLLKEGAVEVERALQRLQGHMSHEAYQAMLKRIRRGARDWPARKTAASEAVQG